MSVIFLHFNLKSFDINLRLYNINQQKIKLPPPPHFLKLRRESQWINNVEPINDGEWFVVKGATFIKRNRYK